MAKEKSGVVSILKDTLALVLITLVAAVLLGFVKEITAEPIAEREEKTKQEAYLKVFPSAAKVVDPSQNEELSTALAEASSVLPEDMKSVVMIDEACLAQDAAGNTIGYIVTVTDKKGYGGSIQMVFGCTTEGSITGLQFLQIGETAGFGLEAEKNPEWRKQYLDKNVAQFTVTKNGAKEDAEIDALSGATITSRAVTQGVNGGLLFIESLKQKGIGGIR